MHAYKNIPDDKMKRIPKGDGHIPGYCGFVQSITAENLYGKSYGTTTFEVHQAELRTKKMLKGFDILPVKCHNQPVIKCWKNV